MSSDIEFGDVQHAQPQRGLRPDQDAHFYVAPVARRRATPDQETESEHLDVYPREEDLLAGVAENDLLIYVDLDVMRDMEAHAESNTKVELGGVMLGYQRIDADGRPFVVVTDSLRAEHYEATKGSFKFTHDTWSQITDQRAEFHPDLEMVGWYHTHPGWGIFLSGMDLFICDNFFNRELDIALVIDPVAHERGWFQWDKGIRRARETRQTNQFFLMSNRFRQEEVEYFVQLYRDGPTMVDPRYSQSSSSFGSSQPVVNIMDSRRPIVDVALLAMLTVQFILLALLAWKVISPAPPQPAAINNDPVQSQLAVKQQAYEEVLQTLINSEVNGPNEVVKNYADLQQEKRRLTASLDSQVTHLEKLTREKQRLEDDLAGQTQLAKDLSRQLVDANEKLRGIKSAAVKSDGTTTDGDDSGSSGFWWWLAGGLLSVGLVAVIGFVVGQKRGKASAYQELDELADVGRQDRSAAGNKPNNSAVDDVEDTGPGPNSINFSDEN